MRLSIAAAVAAIDLANFVIIVVDFTVFASQSVVAPVAQLVLSLFFVKVGLACTVFALADVLGSSRWAAATERALRWSHRGAWIVVYRFASLLTAARSTI